MKSATLFNNNAPPPWKKVQFTQCKFCKGETLRFCVEATRFKQKQYLKISQQHNNELQALKGCTYPELSCTRAHVLVTHSITFSFSYLFIKQKCIIAK